MKRIIVVVCLLLSGCSFIDKSAPPTSLHICLQVRIDGEWYDVEQNRNVIIQIRGKDYRQIKAVCRHNVVLQRAVLEEYGYKHFRYVMGTGSATCEFKRMRIYDDLNEALLWGYTGEQYQ